MSVDRPEFEVDKVVEVCDAPLGDVEQDEDGKYVNAPAGNCGGPITWKTAQLQSGYIEDQGECSDCGALYTVEAHT